ncbi:related to APN2-AP endonuclease, exonuclease III homolog [Sporisorium reilianum SRZ2]|uniref:DNA-(apurinic or apyrimidinic site) endonuclease n=1 Tax=Sporisorium reilianum (strain SRZ2) TaxID=999809 RepID=E6ZL28_SPORE|nr:related to APN2-AP endonuclease, exonuclease III homolog [Sporisorium reilianum SRZ2]
MRITVWNINGLRTLKGYQPWYKLPDWEACLEHLGADIACFQETKMTRKQLTEPMCILPSYNAFFNFHPAKGYSGTVTYVKKSVSIPLKAEQGITGRLPVTNVSTNPLIPSEPIGCIPADTRDDVEPQIWNALDDEGRCVVLDLGLFVLFNVYCPNETGPERLEYKMTYYQGLAERAHRLIQAGRQVMIVGDMNIIRDPIDHCDAEQSMKEYGWDHFHQHPARSWFQTFLAPHGKFHDVGRLYHPERKKMFTCWNTLIDARPANYGVRLDYTLVTEGLLDWIKGADIQPDVYGSDHCPIYVDLHDERQIDGKMVKLADLMHGGADRLPPALAACHYDEFSGKQRKLASFFGASKKAVPTTKSCSPAGTSLADQGKTTAEVKSTLSNGSSTKDGTDGGAIQTSTSTAGIESEGSSLADALFSLHSQQEGLNIEMAASQSNAAPATTSSTPAVEPVPPASAPVATTAVSTPSPTKAPASQPSPSGRRDSALAKRAPAATKGKDSGKAKNGASLKGQTSLQSFFAKPKSTSSTASSEPTKVMDLSQETGGSKAPPPAPVNDSVAGTVPNTDIPAASYDETDDAICDFHEATTTTFPAPPAEQSAADRVGASLAWGAIFSPIPAPLCRSHSEPCRAWTVNKPGPNHGRKFWLCNRPVGPGYEKSGRAKGDVNPEFRCNFFLWDSELRSKKKVGDGGGAEGKFFSEVGRERGRKGARRGEGAEGEELGGPWGPHKRVRTGDAS